MAKGSRQSWGSRRHPGGVPAGSQGLRVRRISQSEWHLPHQEHYRQGPLKIITKHTTKVSQEGKSSNGMSATCRGHRLQITVVALLNAVHFPLLPPHAQA